MLSHKKTSCSLAPGRGRQWGRAAAVLDAHSARARTGGAGRRPVRCSCWASWSPSATPTAIGLIDEYCPHRRVSLWFGRNEECGLRCVYHGWKFDVDGHCVDR